MWTNCQLFSIKIQIFLLILRNWMVGHIIPHSHMARTGWTYVVASLTNERELSRLLWPQHPPLFHRPLDLRTPSFWPYIYRRHPHCDSCSRVSDRKVGIIWEPLTSLPRVFVLLPPLRPQHTHTSFLHSESRVPYSWGLCPFQIFLLESPQILGFLPS